MTPVEGWKSKPLSGLLSLIIDFRGKTPKKLGMEWGNGDIPALSANNVGMGKIDFSKECYFGSDALYRKWMTKGDPQMGDVVLTTEAPLGNVAQIPDGRRYILSQRTILLRANDAELSSDYLRHYLTSDWFQNLMRQQSSGTTATGIQRAKLETLSVNFPISKLEQARIAEILSTMDRAIEHTEALITKQQRIRTGLIQDLLTRGIDKHGDVRDEQTHEFKDSPLGRIPAEWTCKPLSHFVPSAEYGISTSLGELGIPVLRMNNFVGGDADLSELKYTDKPVPEKLWLRWGDVLFNRTNSWEHVGRTGMWRNECERATFASYLVRLDPDRSILSPELLNIWLNWSKIQIEMRRFATPAVQQVNINPTNLRKMPAAFPSSIDEQAEIVAQINNHTETLRKTRAVLKKLLSLKAGLMQDLLTGKKRVTTLLEPAFSLIK
jgi:type I restriction enzyme S subunit